MKRFSRHLLAALAVGCAALTAQAAAPRYIFYFIGDGMGLGPVMATETYNRMVHGKAVPNLTMTALPATGYAMTYSASSPVTDSAAAGTALATGNKTKNAMLGMTPDTVAVTSIATRLKEAGWGVGIVTNCAADDATPGAFYAHQPNRAMYYEIGRDFAASGFDFLAGASLRGTTDKKTGAATDLEEVLDQAGVEILYGQKGAESVSSSSSRRIILVNPKGYGKHGANSGETGYAVDNAGDDGEGLTLNIAMDACMTQLQKNSPDRFFMMIEGGLIDHSLHGDDGTTAVREILAFNGCIDRAMDFYAKHPEETLIVITADHDTGGMAVGSPTTGYTANPAYVDAQRVSKGVFSDYCTALLKNRSIKRWEDMEAYLRDNLGFWDKVPLTEKQTDKLKKAFEDTFVNGVVNDEKGLYKTSNAFATTVFGLYNQVTGWGFVTTSHTGNPVPVYAIGDGASIFSRKQDNTDIPRAILQLVTGK